MVLLKKIDSQRGDVPRSRVVERALNEKYAKLELCKSQEKNLGCGQ